jgi:hypothetical protein
VDISKIPFGLEIAVLGGRRAGNDLSPSGRKNVGPSKYEQSNMIVILKK